MEPRTGSSGRDGCDVACVHPKLVSRLDAQLVSHADAAATASLFAVLADQTRVRILHALTLADELCVCDLAWLVGMSISAVSHQLRFLRDRSIVERRRVGRLVYYRVVDPHVGHVLADAVAHSAEAQPRVERRSMSAA